MTDDDFLAAIGDGVSPIDRYFLVGETGHEMVGLWDERVGIRVCVIEDHELVAPYLEFLRRRGSLSFESPQDVVAHAARVQWPGWERGGETRLP